MKIIIDKVNQTDYNSIMKSQKEVKKKPKPRQVTVRLEPSFSDELDRMAAELGLPRAGVINMLMRLGKRSYEKE